MFVFCCLPWGKKTTKERHVLPVRWHFGFRLVALAIHPNENHSTHRPVLNLTNMPLPPPKRHQPKHTSSSCIFLVFPTKVCLGSLLWVQTVVPRCSADLFAAPRSRQRRLARRLALFGQADAGVYSPVLEPLSPATQSVPPVLAAFHWPPWRLITAPRRVPSKPSAECVSLRQSTF